MIFLSYIFHEIQILDLDLGYSYLMKNKMWRSIYALERFTLSILHQVIIYKINPILAKNTLER